MATCRGLGPRQPEVPRPALADVLANGPVPAGGAGREDGLSLQPRQRLRAVPGTAGGRTRGPREPRDVFAKAAYDVSGLLENLDWLDEMVRHMNDLDWDVHSFDHEDANSQFEFDFAYAVASPWPTATCSGVSGR